MKKRISLLVVFVLILTMLCGCGSKDSEAPVPDTSNTENSEDAKSAVNDNKILGKADNTDVDLTMFFYDKNDDVICFAGSCKHIHIYDPA